MVQVKYPDIRPMTEEDDLLQIQDQAGRPQTHRTLVRPEIRSRIGSL